MTTIRRHVINVGLVLALGGLPRAQATSYTVTLEPPVHGTVALVPALPADGKYPTGTNVTVRATPDAGYALDSVWYSVPGRFGKDYHESPSREFTITIDRDKGVGASFVEQSVVRDIDVTNNVVFAQPGVKPLKYDVYSPKGARNLPVLVIIHGGGWNANNEDVMRGLARELTKGGRFVAVSMDYRWSRLSDGDAIGNTMADLIEDVFGGIAHVAEHAAQYGGDPTRIGVTGDSAGGHLAAVASLMTNRIGSGGFGKAPGVFEFMPSYVPKGKTVEQVRAELTAAIKAAAPSYGVFGGTQLNAYSTDPAADEAWKAAIAPLSNIPPASVRSVPQFLMRGTQDRLITDAGVKEFVDALVKAGQRVEYVQVGGASHAFLDWKPDARTKATFAQYGVPCAAAMRTFFESVLH
jgi:acetyl esterase/lipase